MHFKNARSKAFKPSRKPPMHKPMTVEDKKKKAEREACRRKTAIEEWKTYVKCKN